MGFLLYPPQGVGIFCTLNIHPPGGGCQEENKENAVTVNYSADCEFLLAELNTQAEDLTNVTRGSVSDIKKQSIVYVYGNFIDAHNLNADKIIIARFEQR